MTMIHYITFTTNVMSLKIDLNLKDTKILKIIIQILK